MRLIDADLLREHLFVTESRTGGSRDEQAYEQGWDDALKAVMVYEPTVVDTVEVVRCKDCKYCNYLAPRKRAKRDDRGNLIGFDDVQDPPYCDWWCDNGDGFDVEENDFCSHAERKETE